MGSLIALDAIWRRVADPTKTVRDLVVVDEAWQLLAARDGATWLFRLAKSARKYATGLSIVTQDVADVLATDLGRAIVANSATQILLRQAPQAIDHVVDTFGLTSGERAFLLSAGRGEALLVAGSTRVAFAVHVSDTESATFQSTPAAIRAGQPHRTTAGPGGAP